MSEVSETIAVPGANAGIAIRPSAEPMTVDRCAARSTMASSAREQLWWLAAGESAGRLAGRFSTDRLRRLASPYRHRPSRLPRRLRV